MKMPQGNSLCNLNQKCHFFLLLFLHKLAELKGRTGPVWGVGTSGRGEEVGKGCGRVNIV
jgi:hypothetical protein